MIFRDRTEAKRVMDGKVRAVLRPATSSPHKPYTQESQKVQWRRKATNEDHAPARERQAAKPDIAVVVDSLGNIQITDQTRTTLGALKAKDAQALGVGNLTALRSWCRQHLGPWRPAREVWIVRFAVVREVEEIPHYLGKPGPSGDYTTDPAKAIDDLETIDAPTQIRLVDAARKRDKLRSQRKYDEWDLGEELKRKEAEAAELGVDISHHRGVIADRIARIDRAIQQRKAA
jgi:hypothetical protein